MHAIAVIHARGGSKRIPLKNIKPLGGRPLIAWCIDAALKSKLLDRVIVSTDHDGITEAAREAGADVPFKRPADLAEDVPSELVTRHALEFHEQETGHTLDVIVTIQPTTPFIQPSDIDACLYALENNPSLDSAVSVAPIHERPEWMYRRDEAGIISNWTGRIIKGDLGVSQTLEPLVMPNGGVYASRRETLCTHNLIKGPHCYGHIMSRTRSVDIDDPIDLLVAETVAQYLADHPDE
ncbi:MAG: acylneuraminate cytidylyltransferase family protein [Rhodospirillaceae bacterium]|jgi:CMP-N,N'-diacetyllegionaminic acid synthase